MLLKMVIGKFNVFVNVKYIMLVLREMKVLVVGSFKCILFKWIVMVGKIGLLVFWVLKYKFSLVVDVVVGYFI